MSWLSALPTVNACLNATSGVLLVLGYRAIRRREIERHRKLMLSACTVSLLFLVSYLTYHLQEGTTRFPHQGLIRPVYFTILISHTILAAATLPLVIITLRFALKKTFPKHRRLARWTFPIWTYVSVTGVVVYLMLYHL